MTGILYFIIIILANTVGAISGMGGGVLIKPLLDVIGAHSVPAITFYSTVAVFTMSIVSTLRQRKNLVIDFPVALQISVGAILGGMLGNLAFEGLLDLLVAEKSVQLVQIILTLVTIGFSYIVSESKRNLRLQGWQWYSLVGLVLGFLASLLGIGGGPINVAMLLLCFGMPIKSATVYSIITIFFSQLAKIITIAGITGFGRYDLSMLFYVIPAAILGGFLGALFSGRLNEQSVRRVYQAVLLLVLCINGYNGIQILLG